MSPQLRRILLVLIPFVCAARNSVPPARHYSYSESDPAQWTSSALPGGEAAAASDFTALPCNLANCTVAQLLTDANRNTYVVGSRYIPVRSSSGPTELSEVYVAKLDPSGGTLFLATFSGKGSDQGHAIAVDPAGNLLIGGSTSSTNFPVRNAFQAQRGMSGTGFLMKLSADGSQLIYSTYFGGTTGMSSVDAVAIDSAGNAYVTGQTGSRDFSTTPGMPAGSVTGMGPGGTLGAFVAKLSPSGEQILYSGRISGGALACSGGSSCFLSIRSTSGNAIALDAAGNAYITGNSNVTDLPTTQGALAPQGIGGWVARVNASGAKLDYLTYLGAARYGGGSYVSAATWVGGLAVDAAGNAYIAGQTSDPKFPATPGAFQPAYDGPADPPSFGAPPPSDAFVAKLNPQGTAMVYATFLGGAGADAATALALDSTGSAYVTGETESMDFPVTVGAPKEGDFLAVLSPEGSALKYSSRYPRGSIAQQYPAWRSIAVDADGRVRTASPTGVVFSLTLATALSTRLFGIMNAAGGQPGPAVSPGEVVSMFGTELGPVNGVSGQPDSAGKMPTSLAGTEVLFDGVAAPLLYVSQDQVNTVAPFALSPGQATTIRIIAGSATSSDFHGFVLPARPGIFGTGAAAALNEDGTVNSESNPAKAGSVVAIWATGVGPVYPPPIDGQVAAGAQDYHCCSVYVLDKPADVVYGGAAPGLVAGVVQVNFRVPTDIGSSGFPVQVPFRISVYPTGANQPLASTSWIWVTP